MPPKKRIHELHEQHEIYRVAAGDGLAAGERVAAGDGFVAGDTAGEAVGDGDAAGGCRTGTLAPAISFHSPFRFANVSRKR